MFFGGIVPLPCAVAGITQKSFGAEQSIVEIKFKSLLFKNYYNTPVVVVRKEILKDFQFNVKQKYCEDHRLWLEIAYKYKCMYINDVLAGSIEGKRAYGVSGLSSNLWKMEAGELSNFRFLYKKNMISWHQYVMSSSISLMKYCRRVIISKISVFRSR